MTPPHALVWVAAIWLFVIPTQVIASDIRSLRLEQAVELALQRNPTLQAQAFTIYSAKASEITAGLRPNPVFVSSSQDFTAGLTQLFERGGKRQRRIEAAKLSTDIATNEFSDARRSLILQVRKAFTAALLAKSNGAGRGEYEELPGGGEPRQNPISEGGDLRGRLVEDRTAKTPA